MTSQEGLPVTSEFPSFHNGDVLVVIHANELYQLHSEVLRRCSPKHFGNLVDPRYAAHLTKAAQNAGCFTRYKLVLQPSAIHSNGVFQRQDVDKHGRTTTNKNCHSMLEDVYSNGLTPGATEAWKNLFRTFYNLEPEISGPSLQAVLEKVLSLMDAADSVEAASTVRAYVDNALMRQGQLLYRAVLARPVLWGNLALRLESPAVFKDAVIHIVGRWNSLTRQEKEDMHPHLRAVCEQKATELYKIKGAVEMRILGHYPQVLWRKANEVATSRASYANDIYMWIAVDIFRQWAMQVIGIERRGRDGKDGGAQLYRAIYEGGSTYLNAQDYAVFHNICPMSQKARTILYDKVRQMKFEVRRYAKCLMSNQSQLDLRDGLKVDHLLCTQLQESELPWNIKDPQRLIPSELEEKDDDEDMEEPEGGLPPADLVENVYGTTILSTVA